MCVSSIVLMTVGGPIVLNRVMLSSNRFEGIELPRRGRVRIVSALRMHFDCQRLVKAAAKRRSSSPGETSSMLVKIHQTIPNGSIQPLAPPLRTGPRRRRPVGGGRGPGGSAPGPAFAVPGSAFRSAFERPGPRRAGL